MNVVEIKLVAAVNAWLHRLFWYEINEIFRITLFIFKNYKSEWVKNNSGNDKICQHSFH